MLFVPSLFVRSQLFCSGGYRTFGGTQTPPAIRGHWALPAISTRVHGIGMSEAAKDQFMLPPSRSGRDLAAEVATAALGLAVSQGRHIDDAPASAKVRPLRLLALPAKDLARRFSRHFGETAAAGAGATDHIVELVSEEVSEITNGRLRGSTWLKPLAMRVLHTGGSVHTQYTLFGTLVPSLVVPTCMLKLDVAQAAVLRCMHHVWVSQDESIAPRPAEVRLLQLFARLIDQNRRARPECRIQPAKD